MESIKIKRATKSDSETVVDLVFELLYDFNTQSGSNFALDRDSFISVTEKLMDENYYAAYIAYEEGKPVGVITISKSSAIYNGGDFGVITELYVDRGARSKGIGKLLLEAAYDFAAEMGWKKLEVGAPMETEWPRTIEFYKRNGFKEKGRKLRVEL